MTAHLKIVKLYIMQKQKKTNIKLTNEEHNTLIHKHKTTQPVKLINETFI